MSDFPLYMSLDKDIKTTRDLSKKQKNNFIDDFKIMDDKGLEMIYLLIRFYELNNKDGSRKDYQLPYHGKYEGDDIMFDFDKFPKKLKRMLFNFQKLHIKKMEEDKQKNELVL